MFGGLVRRSTVDAWRCLFDDEEHLESRAFPPFHKIVLGLSSLDLGMQLDLSTAGIDEKDTDGQTALSWAATRGDFKNVSLLLKYRADPNVTSIRGQTPLHWASQNPTGESSQILQALIDAGSNVNQIDYWKRRALIYASCNQDDPKCLEILVKGGANLNSQDCHQRTPLGYAAKMGKFKGLKYLLSVGADANLVDIWGFPPLFEVLQHNHHDCLRSLLQNDPVPTLTDVNGMSALHITALHSDSKSMNMLAEQRLDQVELKKFDKTGLTAQDIFDQRANSTAEDRKAFERLFLKSCIPRGVTLSASRSCETMHECSDEEEICDDNFVDALEKLDITDTPEDT